MPPKKKKSSALPTVKSMVSIAKVQSAQGKGSGKNKKVNGTICGFPASQLPVPRLPSAPRLTNPAVHSRVFGGWFLEGGQPKHAMELCGDRTLDMNITLGIDRRCRDLPIALGNDLRMWLGTNTFGALVCERLKLTAGLFGPAVDRCPRLGQQPGVRCGHWEVYIMGLYESEGAATLYSFLWSIFEGYGPFILDRIVDRRRSGKKHHQFPVDKVERWKAALFNPAIADNINNDYSQLGPWLLDALRLHGQEMGRPFELLERAVTVADTTLRECSVISDTIAIATHQAMTSTEAKHSAISETLRRVDFLATTAVDLLYEHAAETDTEVEFSVGTNCGVFTACVHWGNGSDSRVIGRAMRATAIESQSAAALVAARSLNLSLTEFAASGRMMINGETDDSNDYAVEFGPSGPVLVLE